MISMRDNRSIGKLTTQVYFERLLEARQLEMDLSLVKGKTDVIQRREFGRIRRE